MAVSAVKKEAPKPAESTAAEKPPAPAKKRRWLWLVLGLLLVTGIAGGAWWYLHRPHDDNAMPEAKPTVAVKPPVFAPLDLFTVNLQQEDTAQFLQVGLTLQVADDTTVDLLKQHTPEIRDRVLLLMSSKKASELLTVDGKHKLSEEIRAAINAILVPSTTPTPETAVAAAPTPAPAADGTTPMPSPSPEATPPADATPAAPQPVLAVLFTSFIVQ